MLSPQVRGALPSVVALCRAIVKNQGMLIRHQTYDRHSPQRQRRPFVVSCGLRRWRSGLCGSFFHPALYLLLATSTLFAADTVDFDREIAPLFAAKCLKCHGAAGPEAGLSLTGRDPAFKTLASGQAAIVPSDPAASELLRRIATADPDTRMPPSGPALSQDEIALLRRWIETGAAWPDHWAYRPLVRPALPIGDTKDGTSPIDHFVHHELQRHQLTPSPEADRRTLYRRLSVDLHGLLPMPADVEAFVADPAADAYERLVDQLLSDPRYG